MSAISDLRRAGPPAEVAAILPGLLRGDVIEGVTVMKEGAVYRVGGTVVKLYRRSHKRFAGWRAPQALRAVRSYFRLLPVRSPKPLHWDRLDHPDYGSLLVYEFEEGATLSEVWHAGEPKSRAALPQLFADLYATGVLHADLHASNLLWGPKGWIVIDLDGVRHGLHALRRRAINEKIWVRLRYDFRDDAGAKEVYREFLELAGRPWDAETSWARILESPWEVKHGVELT